MTRHDYKNLSQFLDTKKNSHQRWGQVHLCPNPATDSVLMYASDGQKLASISTPAIDGLPDWQAIEDGTRFLAALALADAPPVLYSETFVTVGDEVFPLIPAMPSYRRLETHLLTTRAPRHLESLGFFTPHALTLSRMKDSKGKPAVITLKFREGLVQFSVGGGSSLTGMITSNTLTTIEATT